MKLIILITLFFSSSINAQTPLEVKSLDYQRNCWYRYFDSNQMLQVADFGGFNPLAMRVGVDDLKAQIADAINVVNEKFAFNVMPQGKFRAYLFCNASGHSLILNGYESTPSFIFTARLDNLEEGNLNYNADKAVGFNLGYSPHTIIFKHKKNILGDHYITLLKSFFPNIVAAARVIGNTQLGRLQVLPGSYFKLNEVMNQLQEHPVLKNYTEYMELNGNQLPSGEHGLLIPEELSEF